MGFSVGDEIVYIPSLREGGEPVVYDVTFSSRENGIPSGYVYTGVTGYRISRKENPRHDEGYVYPSSFIEGNFKLYVKPQEMRW